MASRVFVAKKIKLENLPKVELNTYSKITLNDLVVYAVHYMQKQGIIATVEEIVSICFRLFPHSFSLKNHPRWPDSALVIRRLNDGREKGNIKGSAAEGFLLKYKGNQRAMRIARRLGLAEEQAAPLNKKNVFVEPVKTQRTATSVVLQKKKSIAIIANKKSPKKQLSKVANPKKMIKAMVPEMLMQISKEEKAKAGKVIQLLERSDAYRHYKKNGDRSKISEFDFRNMLFTTMESSPETLTRNVELFKRYAGIQHRTDLIAFLDFCKGSFASLLRPQARQLVKKKR